MKEKTDFSFKDAYWAHERKRMAHKPGPHTAAASAKIKKGNEHREFSFQTAGKHAKNVKQISAADPYSETMGSYSSIEAGISTRMQQKYCDFIGFHAKATDPKTKLRYFSSE